MYYSIVYVPNTSRRRREGVYAGRKHGHDRRITEIELQFWKKKSPSGFFAELKNKRRNLFERQIIDIRRKSLEGRRALRSA